MNENRIEFHRHDGLVEVVLVTSCGTITKDDHGAYLVDIGGPNHQPMRFGSLAAAKEYAGRHTAGWLNCEVAS